MLATHPGIEERQTQLEALAEGSTGDKGEAAYQARIEPLLWGLIEDELRRAQYDESIVPPPQAHRSLGFIHRQQGRKDEAAQALQRYLDALPAAPDAGLLKSYVSELKT
jgi:hypothetical protein